MPKSKKDLTREKFLQLADILGNDPVFCALVDHDDPEACITRSELLDEFITTVAEGIEYNLRASVTVAQDFHSRLCATKRSELSPAALQLMELFKIKRKTTRHQVKARQHIANRIGFKSPAQLNECYLPKLQEPYPPANHIILEQHYDPFPPKPPVIDTSCTYIGDYHNLDESRIQYTFEADESCILYDQETRKPVAIVVRDLAEDYFNIIQPWAVALVKDSMSRRTFSRRNNPQLARVGVSSGSRSAGLFGWVRNLKPRFKEANDKQQHEQDISSLFGFFYALIRSRLPSIVKDTFENAIKESEIPRLDQYGTEQFTLPFDRQKITFSRYPLSPPEGYIAHNFYMPIHKDPIWRGCPWGVYWNLLRCRKNGTIGKEAGASFFISSYGIRIVNASNTCVAWNLNHLHGTGYYEKGLEHVGITILLSKFTETSWEKYKKAVQDGILQGEGLHWYDHL
jgi:hypothetical protein